VPEATPVVSRVIATCSFCSRPNNAVGALVAGPGVFICDECVSLCAQVIEGKPPMSPRFALWEQEIALDDALAHLAPVAAAGAQVKRNLGAWVHKARRLGASWAQVGAALGMRRQSAWERFAADD